ncbi:MAG: acyl-CoA dehydrogenase family protein [Spirochaetota bacterium]|nr:acyl-CoA dehydrogenase family protein [Spirochaetota bacterium]
MDLGFTSEQEMLRETAAKFFVNECPSEKVREIEESESGYSSELWSKIAELGWTGVLFPEEYGGYGGQFIDIVIIMEEMGRAVFPSPFFSTVVQCGMLIQEGGSEDQKKDLLAKITEGSLIMAFAQHEEDGSYLPSGINMKAEASGNQYTLNGTKMFVMDANIADKLIVAAKADAGITLFLVDAKSSGITCTKMPTIGMDNCCEVIFKDVKVDKGDIIGGAGKGWDIIEKIWGRASVAKSAEMIGGCKASIDMTAEYSKERVQYGQPIGGYDVLQHYMANMLLAYDTSFNYLHKVTWMIDEGMDHDKEASALKSQVNENYKFITERGVQIHGGVGTSREFDIGLYYRRAKSFEYVMGDTDYHYEKVAKALGL